MHRELVPLGKDELFTRLAGGHAARITVLTPNRRLAQSLHRDFEAAQVARGLPAWETADILPFDAFVARLWEDALYSDLAPGIPLLLAPAQEQALWEEAIRATKHADALLSAASAASQARQAWQLAQAWRLDPRSAGALNEDAQAFLDWSARYERATREKGQTDAARLPDVVAPLLSHGALRKPATVALFGFDLGTPQLREFLDALAAQGCKVIDAVARAQNAKVARLEFIEARDEIAAAARWARSRLEADATARIGVVVPDLAQTRARVQRIFANVLQPDHLVAAAAKPLPFNLSLGAPLAASPMAGDALLLLALTGRDTSFEHASRLIRSPFIAGAQAEMDARARLDAWLRERCGPSVALETLVRLCASAKAPRAGLLLDRLERLAAFRKASLFGVKSAAEWAKAFSEALRVAGFPGDRALDSVEHQTLDKWHELLAEFATLERVTAKMRHDDACPRLGRMAQDTIFQPETGEVPIQVAGVLESAGLEFDHLWVMGLTDEAWPLAARPNPFIPVSVQRRAGIPQADPVSSLELDRRITDGWLRSAREVVVSHARMKDESELAPSPLIAALPLAKLEDLDLRAFATLREAIRRAGTLATVEDAQAPAAAAGMHSGGTSLFRDQAACPFRAFARHRLDSEPLETPRPGLDARDRGTLVHAMLAAVWKSLESRQRLEAAAPAHLEELLALCADEAIAHMKRKRAEALGERFAQLERDRLVRLAREWLAVEAKRADFEVIAVEDKRPVTFGGIAVNVKLDRMDRLAAGGNAIIDYKTGACATSAWMGERPDEPQLPLYALGGGGDVAAVAFAQVRAGEMGYRGIGRLPDLIPGVRVIGKDQSRAARQYKDWQALIDGWRAELEATGKAFAAGDARVDPKRGAPTCENCDQHMLCRIAEKAPFGVVRGGEADE